MLKFIYILVEKEKVDGKGHYMKIPIQHSMNESLLSENSV